jgi:hypothetical protein
VCGGSSPAPSPPPGISQVSLRQDVCRVVDDRSGSGDVLGQGGIVLVGGRFRRPHGKRHRSAAHGFRPASAAWRRMTTQPV